MKQLVALLVAGLLFQSAYAGPNINIGVVYDYLAGDKSTYLKRVYNSGDSTAFVKINVLEIIYNVDGTSSEVPVKVQADASARDGLMASPARLIIPAQGMQGTRLLFMGERDKERYFRVRFVPVVPEKEDEFAVSQEEREDYKKTLTAGVNVMAGFGTIFFVRPANTRFDSVIEDSAGAYKVRNNGNTVVVIDEFKSCSKTDETDCEPTTKHHVMAGKSFEFEKKPGREYRFILVEGEAKKNLRVTG